MNPPRIAIASPSANAWSETFIAAHLERLHGVELVLVDGELPTRVAGGPLLRGRTAPGRLADRLLALLRGTDPQGLVRHRIARLLQRRGIEVLLAEYGNCAQALIGPARAAGVPLVAHFHGFDAHRMDYVERLGRYRELFASAAALVVVSRAMERQLLALGAPPEKVVYNCYGIDVGRFAAGAPEQAPPHFVAVGRFVEKKAPQRTIAAFARALAQVPAARLTLVGKGPLWEDCVRQVQELGIGHAVDLCGVRTPDEIAALLRGARAFVQHSVRAANGDSEGTPLAVLEAMATGIPVIATRHTGIADVVGEEREGLLCEEHDVEGMAHNLVRVALDPALAGRLGRAGRAKAEREHRVEDSIARLQAILERAAHR
jgi:glycosyltransferase involved in cell wall biosynthesis